jgi:PDZ domain-containing protein
MKSPDDPNRVIIGFVPSDTRSVRVPFDVKISTAGIGGPSAGLAFTLSLLDELTPGNLMGRGRVVATGTINEDGSVGAIGALEQKAVAVKDAGGTLFLVPAGQSASEMKAARDAVGNSVTIVQVGTVEEALVQLAKNGGEGLPAPPK